MSDEYYEHYWEQDHIQTGSPHLVWKKTIVEGLPLSGKRLLDVGCGNGFIAASFVDRFETYGVDISTVALKAAAEKGIRTAAIDANQMELPYPDQFFDVIICLDVLEHVFDPLALTKEIHAKLVPQGTFIVCVPNILNLFNRIHFLRGEFVDVMDVAHRTNALFSEHIRLFSKSTLETLLDQASFKVTQRYFYFPQKFSETSWKKVQFLGDLVNALKIPQRLPTLFALGLLYVCQKS
ncbi:MAG: class I SAM-dependent methyltransferase [Gemmatimonadetes bacterium]|nr:MAG: class I SAM-dependent methyltransferase [Gemmatimonadota bacterium]